MDRLFFSLELNFTRENKELLCRMGGDETLGLLAKTK